MGDVISTVAKAAFSYATGGWGGMLISMAVSMVASSILSKVFAPNAPKSSTAQAEPNPGVRQTLPPAGDNKLPVVYGTAYLGGAIIDTSITSDNQNMYYVVALCEVTNTETGGTPDEITFGDIFWGGKKCVFDGTDLTKVTGLQDTSTNEIQDISGYMNIYLYKNGSYQPANGTTNAVAVMNATGLTYTWGGNKLMSNCAFAIIHLKFSQSRNLTGFAQMRFQVTNARSAPGDCFLDYFTSTRYGAAIPLSAIDTTSLADLNSYSNAPIGYTTWTGGSSTISRYRFDGVLDTNQKIMNNIQSMSDCCMCLVRYDEITGKWGVIVQKPTVTPVMDINDTNMISGITITPIDLSNSFNIIECKFPNGTEKDSFNTATFDLAVINPSLLFPNEPVNKQSVSLYLINSNVRAQYIANIMLEQAREDLQVNVEIDYQGLQLQAGDIVTVTSEIYGWTLKQFRIAKVVQKFNEQGQVFATLQLMEFNASVYDDKGVTEFTPANNTGLPSAITFGSIPAPTIGNIFPNAANPAFSVYVTSSSAGITQYAEVWYSAYQYPTSDQRIFAGTTEVQANGNPYDQSTLLPAVQLFNIPAGNWYFFSRMVNGIASSDFSLASNVLNWRPTTFQFTDRYIAVAYADDINGGGFSLTPTNKFYFGLYNSTSTTIPTDPAVYKWYLADPLFGTNKYLVFINYANRKFGFDTDFAMYAGGGGAFVPSTTSKFDFRIWSALENGINYIDLDHSTGQVIQTGTTTVSTGEIAINNTPDGKLVASLAEFLSFPNGASTFTGSAATITIDKYGRIVGFSAPDNFYFSRDDWTATSGQTVFTPTTRDAGYIAGQDLIFINGALISEDDYTETTTDFTLNTGADLGDIVTCISMRAVSSSDFYQDMFIYVDSVAGNDVIWDAVSNPYQIINVGDELCFSNTGTPTTYTVSAVNPATKTITFSTTPSATAGNSIYLFRSAGSSYPVFSRYEYYDSNFSSYTPTEWAFNSGYELPFINGTLLNEQDYDIVSGAITNFPAVMTGELTIIQFNMDNLTTPVGNIANVVTYSVNGQTLYSFNFNSILDLYANGLLLLQLTDYTTGTNSYTMATPFDNTSTILVQQTFASQGAA